MTQERRASDAAGYSWRKWEPLDEVGGRHQSSYPERQRLARAIHDATRGYLAHETADPDFCLGIADDVLRRVG